jgi:hypothetical protein
LPELPAEITRVLDDLVTAAREAFGDRLHSVVLFGSAAHGVSLGLASAAPVDGLPWTAWPA